MITINIPKDKILQVVCFTCCVKYNLNQMETCKSANVAELTYCANCGKLITIIGPPYYNNKFNAHWLKILIIGKDIYINILPPSNFSKIPIEHQITFNSHEELVTALSRNKQLETCIRCRGNKQIWDPITRFMEDCNLCNGKGTI